MFKQIPNLAGIIVETGWRVGNVWACGGIGVNKEGGSFCGEGMGEWVNWRMGEIEERGIYVVGGRVGAEYL